MICDNCVLDPVCTTGCEEFMKGIKPDKTVLNYPDKIFKRWLYGVRPKSYYDNIQKIINGNPNVKI